MILNDTNVWEFEWNDWNFEFNLIVWRQIYKKSNEKINSVCRYNSIFYFPCLILILLSARDALSLNRITIWRNISLFLLYCDWYRNSRCVLERWCFVSVHFARKFCRKFCSPRNLDVIVSIVDLRAWTC